MGPTSRYDVKNQEIIKEPNNKHHGKEGQIKVYNAPTFLQRMSMVKVNNLHMNRGSLIDYLNQEHNTKLSKGYFGFICGSSDRDVINLAKHHIVKETFQPLPKIVEKDPSRHENFVEKKLEDIKSEIFVVSERNTQKLILSPHKLNRPLDVQNYLKVFNEEHWVQLFNSLVYFNSNKYGWIEVKQGYAKVVREQYEKWRQGHHQLHKWNYES